MTIIIIVKIEKSEMVHARFPVWEFNLLTFWLRIFRFLNWKKIKIKISWRASRNASQPQKIGRYYRIHLFGVAYYFGVIKIYDAEVKLPKM